MECYKQSWQDSKTQILAALLACSLHLHVGICMAFATILLPPEMLVEMNQFENATDVQKTKYSTTNQSESELSFNIEEASWMTSLLALASAFGSAVAGLAMDRWGRKIICFFTGILYLIGWLLTICVNESINLLYASRAISGFAEGLCMTGLVYTSEITHPSVRTALMSSASVFTCVGIFLTTVMGYFITWRGVAIFSACSSAVLCIGLYFIPETPQWLSENIKDEEKRKTRLSNSLAWLYKDPNILKEELNRYTRRKESKETIEIDTITGTILVHGANECSKSNEPKDKLWRAVILLSILFVFQETSGGYVVIFYALQIFQATGSRDLNGWTCLMVLGSIRFLMSIAASFQTFGRKTLLMTSSLGMAIMVLIACLWLHFEGPSLPSTIFVLLFVAFSALGVLIIPWTLIAELLPSEYRGSFSGYMFCLIYILMFIVIKVAIVVLDAVGIANFYLIFGLFSAGMSAFVYFYIPETRGKSLEEIQQAL